MDSIGGLVVNYGGSFPFTVYKNQGFKSPSHRSKLPLQELLIIGYAYSLANPTYEVFNLKMHSASFQFVVWSPVVWTRSGAVSPSCLEEQAIPQPHESKPPTERYLKRNTCPLRMNQAHTVFIRLHPAQLVQDVVRRKVCDHTI